MFSDFLRRHQVLIQAKNIRDSIAANEAENSAIEMMILVFSIVHAEASEMLFEGAGRIAGRRKKKPFKGLLGVLGAIDHFLDENEKLTVQQLWEWRFKKLIKDDDDEKDTCLRLSGDDTGSEFEIFFYEDRIVQNEKKKSGITVPRSIGWESFKKYVPKAKELRKEKW